ncbi:MAG: VOC family protein [Flavobacteriaceae bacterium]|nr:VOC family protein [Flavobacteriaceae bacterium]
MNLSKQKITPFLWFNMECEEAVNFYIDVFNNAPHSSKKSKLHSIQRYEKGIETPNAEKMWGKVLTAEFELEGHRFQALDGGIDFPFNESISLLVECEDQEEVDYYWKVFTQDGGKESVCGWLKDKYGLSWQIIPKKLSELLGHPDREKAHLAANAMLQMKKIEIADLEKAFDQK